MRLGMDGLAYFISMVSMVPDEKKLLYLLDNLAILPPYSYVSTV